MIKLRSKIFAMLAGCLLVSSFAAAAPHKAKVLLITSKDLAQSWQRFADWKTQLGKPTKIVTVQQIDKDYEGADIQQKIRACVLAHVKSDATKWVILGGDSQPGGKGIVPDRDTRHNLGRDLNYFDIPTDIYYVSEKSWDANGDGIYGDIRNDASQISYTGKACIGRIPVRTEKDVQAYTDKIIAYETKYPAKDFAKKMLYTCAVWQANYKATMLWDRYLSPLWNGATCAKFFVNKTPWDTGRPGSYNLTPQNWVSKLNSKTFGKMHMHGHGLLHCWQLEGRGRRAEANTRTVTQLKNKDAYLVMTTVSCFTGHYDDRKDPCISEAMLRQPNAGAVIVVSPSRYGVPIFQKGRDPRDGKTQDGTTKTLTRFWIHALSKGLTAGEAFAEVKKEFAKDALKHAGFHWCQCEINLLGDPTLDLRANDPITPDLSADMEAGKIIVKTKPGLTVCVWKGNEFYQVKTANDKGIATFDVKPSDEGTIKITVTGPSVNAVTKEIAVKK